MYVGPVVATAMYAKKQYIHVDMDFTSRSLALEVDLSDWNASSCFKRAKLSGSSSHISTKTPEPIFSTSFPGTGGNSTDKRSGSGSLEVEVEAVWGGAGCCDPTGLPLPSPIRRGVGTEVACALVCSSDSKGMEVSAAAGRIVVRLGPVGEVGVDGGGGLLYSVLTLTGSTTATGVRDCMTLVWPGVGGWWFVLGLGVKRLSDRSAYVPCVSMLGLASA